MAWKETCSNDLAFFSRLLEISCSDRPWEGDTLPPSLALSRSQEPIYSEDSVARLTIPPHVAPTHPLGFASWS